MVKQRLLVAPEVKRDKPTLVLLKIAWIILGADLVLVSSIIALAWPDRMAAWGVALPLLVGFVTAMGAAAFGGPAIRRRQTTAADESLKNDGR